ncbi:hypothetical protein [Streptomyces cadmiisoli]|uniref:hypothetical protein n=1 Tax=Streptomyces cadmiisoli TaxID=2184053 RepID=UPI003654C57A
MTDGQDAHEARDERETEERLRELLAEDAYAIEPSPVPYPAIRRRGIAGLRRRRGAVAGAALVTLAAAPVGAYTLAGADGKAQTAAPGHSATATPSRTASPTPSASPSGPARPASTGQLLDGITFEEAADGLEKCLAYDRSGFRPGGTGLGPADGYRIILALDKTGDSNSPGDGMYVVAVKERPQLTRLICTLRNGRAEGINTSVGADGGPDAGPVVPDSNGGRLHRQSVLDDGAWKLPFRWGAIGTVEPSVTRVTVSYGGETGEADLDHGWFVASGVLNVQTGTAPRVKGYDADGKLVYDSDHDQGYQKTL